MLKGLATGGRMLSNPKLRIVSIILYAVALSALQYYVVSTGFLPNEDSIWLLSGIAGLLFGTRLLNPFFTPPADAATNAFTALAALTAAGLVVTQNTVDAHVLIAAAVFCAVILAISILVLIARPPMGVLAPLWVRTADDAARHLGGPNVIFTLVILVSVWLFHRTRPIEVFAILGAWAVIQTLRPLEALFDFISRLRAQLDPAFKEPIVGLVSHFRSY